MSDLYLKFASAEEADPVLFDTIETHVDENGLPVAPDMEGVYPEGSVVKTEKRQKFLNTDIIGDIFKPTGEMTTVEGPGGEQIEVPVLAKLDGYHVNVRPAGEDVSALEQFKVAPANPVRVWA